MKYWISQLFRVPLLTPVRMVLAIFVAVVTDGLQFSLAAVGWFGPDQFLDCIAMVLTHWLLGIHVLLLPTFMVKLVPVIDDLPTWTACVAAVIALRKREQNLAHLKSANPPPPPAPPVIPQSKV
jgi:hypothetical protein